MPVKPPSLAVQVYEELRRRIVEGQLADRDMLVISALARDFSISPTPIREALARLHAEGLATFTDNVGYRVAPRPTAQDYDHWVQARLVIEVGAMRRASQGTETAGVARLEEINREIEATDFGRRFEGVRLFSDLNRAFHRQLIVISGNPFLTRAYDQMWIGAQFARIHYERGIVHQAKIVAEHDTVIAAVVAGRLGDAADALETHIVTSLGRDAEQ